MPIMQNTVYLAILMLSACLACASHDRGSAEGVKTGEKGIVEGRVTIGPLRPGPVRIDDPEPAPPAKLFHSHRIAVLSEDGSRTVKEVPLDSRGYYRVELPPGSYRIDFVPHDIGMRRMAAVPVTVAAGQTVTQDLNIDTGIR